MESPQYIKNRLKSVKNIGQITKAMEVVSATKMRKAQEVALRSRPYAFKALELLETLMRVMANDELRMKNVELKLAEKREIKNTLIVIVASDRGLAGAFNSQVLRMVENFFKADAVGSYSAVLVGKKSQNYINKKNIPVVQMFTGFGDFVLPEEIAPLEQLIVKGFLEGKWDRVMTVSTHFRSTLKQETLVHQLLPLDVSKISETVKEIVPERGRFSEMRNDESRMTNNATEYILEPNPYTLVASLLPHLVKMQLYHLVLEANASEHSARMVAMKTASDNAGELAEDLTLEFNKARQASITKEIIEITSTMNALQ